MAGGKGTPMTVRTVARLADLYEADETAWLEASAELIRHGRLDALDYPHLAEYLTDMAVSDRRQVLNRLSVLVSHVLKWHHQPDRRTGGWRATVIEQRQRLNRLAATGVLRAHAEAVLADAYADAVQVAAAETGLPPAAFPPACPYTVEQLLTVDLTAPDPPVPS